MGKHRQNGGLKSQTVFAQRHDRLGHAALSRFTLFLLKKGLRAYALAGKATPTTKSASTNIPRTAATISPGVIGRGLSVGYFAAT